MKILITGAAGYIGGMLVDQFRQGPEVQIIALDVRNQPKELDLPHVVWCIADLRKSDWHAIISGVKPDVVIHAAWAGRQNEQMVANVFDYCVRNKIPKFIHLSAIDGYGTVSESLYIENDPLRGTTDIYAGEVTLAEQAVKKIYGGSQKHTQTFLLRLPIIFGPRAWASEHFFATLGLFKKGGLPLLISRPEELLFQAVHEDDVIDILGLLTFNKLSDMYEVYNVATADSVPATGIATIFGKKLIAVSLAIQKLLPFSTSPRLSRSILVDGSKLIKKFKYKFNYTSYEALTTEEGRYGTT